MSGLRALSGDAADALHALGRDAQAELARIIDWWSGASVDSECGGFFGEIDATGAPRADADKAVVLNTRLLWFFSAAGRLDLAQRAADYVSAHFLDPRRGGLFWMLDADGRPINRRKQAYAQAFGIYAFAAHFAASKDQASLDIALTLFDVLETHFLDSVGEGYWEARDSDFSPIADVRLSDKDLNAPKTMNTHLHLLEAYTALYRIHPTRPVAEALTRSIHLILDRIYDRELGHLRLFFDEHWRAVDQTMSFGHDIEASWLLWEAAEALGDERVKARVRPCVERLAEVTLEEAIGPNGEVFEERRDGHISQRRIWWIQAEALVGFLNAFEMTGDQRFLAACLGVWRFIQRYQLDLDGGEWFASSTLDAPADPPESKADAWKCPYHTGRAMLEVERRAAVLARGVS